MKKNIKRSLQLNAKTLFKFKKQTIDANAFGTTSQDTDPTTVTITTASTVHSMLSI
jgi:hypothetical protein